MKAFLSDGRHWWQVHQLGETDKWNLTRKGELNIRKTDLLFSLQVVFTREELRKLQARIEEIFGARVADNDILQQVKQIVEAKRRK